MGGADVRSLTAAGDLAIDVVPTARLARALRSKARGEVAFIEREGRVTVDQAFSVDTQAAAQYWALDRLGARARAGCAGGRAGLLGACRAPGAGWTARGLGAAARASPRPLSRPQFQPLSLSNPHLPKTTTDQRDEPLDGSYVYYTSAAGSGLGVDVYVLDTGIRTTHQEFSGRAKNIKAYHRPGVTPNNDGHGHGAAGPPFPAAAGALGLPRAAR
jgi:hypothetical protein